MSQPKLHKLGEIDDKEFYLDLVPVIEDEKGKVVPNPSYKKIVTRVPDIREAVISEPGYLILAADYSQIEVKLMAHLSRDPVLIAAINSGKDIHSFNATEVFGSLKHFDYDTITAAKKDKNHPRHAELVKIRNDIKTVTFGVPYGAGKNKVALMTGMTPDEAQEFIDAFFAKFHVLRDWLIKAGEDAIKYGFSTSPRGRHRFYDLPSEMVKEKERERIFSQIRRYAGNMPIQSGNVDMLKPAMANIYIDLIAQGYSKRGARLLFCVHDEIVLTGLEEDSLRRDTSNRILSLEEMKDYNKKKLETVPGPLEKIMMTRMQGSYSSIIPDIVNKIDVSIEVAWEKV